MKVWKINLKATDWYGCVSTYEFLGVASSAKVAINQTMRQAKKEDWTKKVITSVECLGELDFCTK